MRTAKSVKPLKSGPVSHYVRCKLDPNAIDLYVEPKDLVNLDGEMPQVDARNDAKPYDYLFLAMQDFEGNRGARGWEQKQQNKHKEHDQDQLISRP
ncbi:hypothetical protein QBC33DRAFT_558374 [Phialemonium atrogriseum]|uniref:Uncharacterized protein n=1 Tax=Phialemonium atrogriseum TaxID=1093897 RepID=A0AAJ0C1K0_9PEZI|nr:uncharacterized protein QBC33DRAFT_558374 [Phialemonium atrogriseum]KAK1768211.1 hypothetical protein QBC33DRAFT_558374 [Phialemonium atrogriseum]